ncbi:BTB/POZ domain-containing protein NPY1 [Dendrobium catenatum]|uniref:BTB/POZ domain-containing protein NPY1 n=1 Tax=Dendrobium catenatum TaxID=906689 RepID=A0A2I0X6W7_9ASPA|nr:BTB/POZ domain-containing protein NPY1 [Dendrobium catenatum]
MSKSRLMQKLVAAASEESIDEIHMPDIPGEPASIEICSMFCYGIVVTLNAYNVVNSPLCGRVPRMFETVEKGNLIYKIEVFLSTIMFRGRRDSIIVLESTRSLLPCSDDLNRKRFTSENDHTRQQLVPKD